jgi:phage terminase Nu1 subunit (DNA packaging protein)
VGKKKDAVKPKRKYTKKQPKPAPAPALPEGVVATMRDVAKVFGKSERQIIRWKDDGMPVRDDGNYCVADIQTWRAQQELEKRSTVDKQTSRELDLAELELRKEKLRSVQLINDERLGRLVAREEVERQNIRKVATLKDKLLGVPTIMAPQLVGLDVLTIEEVLRLKMEDLIDEFASDRQIADTKGKKRRRK